MSVEIKELIIRAVADSSGEDGPEAGSTRAEHERTELIQACVREVLRVLARSKER